MKWETKRNQTVEPDQSTKCEKLEIYSLQNETGTV